MLVLLDNFVEIVGEIYNWTELYIDEDFINKTDACERIISIKDKLQKSNDTMNRIFKECDSKKYIPESKTPNLRGIINVN